MVDFMTAFNAILGPPALEKLMVVPRYAYSCLKMPIPKGVIMVQGCINPSYDAIRRVWTWPYKSWMPSVNESII